MGILRYVAWRAGTTTLISNRFLAPQIDCLKIPAQVSGAHLHRALAMLTNCHLFDFGEKICGKASKRYDKTRHRYPKPPAFRSSD